MHATKLKTDISFLQASLLIRPGVVWDFTSAGNFLKHMIVYKRGGKSVECLNAVYNDAYSSEERVWMNLLTNIFKLFTKGEESKAGHLT